MKHRAIYCCGCGADVRARLTDGAEIYPHRPDLRELPFWRCDACGNYVGCHHKVMEGNRPLGCIPTSELREARQRAHAVIDPLWKSGTMTRSAVYAAISAGIGKRYHTAETRTLAEVEAACAVAESLRAVLTEEDV